MKQHEDMSSKKMYTAEKKVKFVKNSGKKWEKGKSRPYSRYNKSTPLRLISEL
jgi:hypothetical protein